MTQSSLHIASSFLNPRFNALSFLGLLSYSELHLLPAVKHLHYLWFFCKSVASSEVSLETSAMDACVHGPSPISDITFVLVR